MKEQRALDSDSVEPRTPGAEFVQMRHDRLRRTAPAIQHEVNNALMVLASNLELLGRTAVEGAPRRQLDRAVEAMRRLDATVRGYLDMARRDAPDRAAIPPHQAVAQLLPLLRVVLGNRFGFDLAPAEGIGPALIDRAQLDLALLSLVRDAAHAMPPGARIAARAENREESGEVALVLALPKGAEPGAETAPLFSAAASATGGRVEAGVNGLALVWPRADRAGGTPPG